MAHIAKLGVLTDELVSLLTSTTAKSDPRRFFPYRETALRTLRSNNYPRTNQFDVQSQLEGLEEKFRVYNEDPLADALKERLDEVAKKDIKWAPEILHLLLELSNKPVTNSKLEDLDFLIEPDPDTGPPLKWEDLVAEDPLLQERSVWKNIDFGAESSDDDGGLENSQSDLSGVTDTTVQSSVDEDFNRPTHDYMVDNVDRDGLEKLRLAQFWKKTFSVNGVKLETVKKPITELQTIREIIFMLSGLPTSLFEFDDAHPTLITPSKGYALKHASNDALDKLLQQFADQGSAIMTLRLWLKRRQSIPLLQVFQSSIGDSLLNLDARLSAIQERFVPMSGDVVVSFLIVQTELFSSLRQLIRLSDITKTLDRDKYAHAFRYLELLYDETCVSQMAGDEETYSFMGKIFLKCFEVYLRPMRIWMEDGDLTKDDKVFFVSEVPGEVDLTTLWNSRFKIRKTQNGILHAPKFLHAVASKIFTTGKTVVVLKHLNQFESLQALRSNVEQRLDFESVCKPSFLQLAPFPELFDVAFDKWVQSKHHYTSSVLRKILFDSCGLHISLDALSHLYLLADGTSASNFTNTIFDKLDTLNASWNDRFNLTELAQSSFGSTSSISSDHIRTSTLSLPRKFNDVAECRKSVKILQVVELRYRLSWPIQIILTSTAITSYQKIFTFLFQIRRSSHILTRQRLLTYTLNTTSGTDERALYYALRSRLLWFSQTIYYYLTSLVIEPNSKVMREKLRNAEDVDTMISVHEDYIKTMSDQALLGRKLELIHRNILKILDLSIKLGDAQAANAIATKDAEEEQREMMNRSMASLGLHTPQRKRPVKFSISTNRAPDGDSSEDDEVGDVDLSILSSTYDKDEDELYADMLRKMKVEFDRLVRFVASGLRGVARAGTGEEGRSWDVLGVMLESGLEAGQTIYR